MIRVLVVDDEPHARLKLTQLIKQTPDLELAGVCQDGRDAVQAIRTERPELVFLDIQMPELGGFEVLESLKGDKLPYLIFTTAYSEHAARAFEVEAVDYLLKPFDKTRFEQAVERARRLMGAAQAVQPDLARLSALLDRRLGKARILVKVGNAIRPLDPAAVLYVRAAGDYLRLKLADEELRIRERMKDIEEQVPDTSFVRIHRSVLVNLDHVKEMKPKKHGDYAFHMADGVSFISGSTYRANVKRILEQRGRPG